MRFSIFDNGVNFSKEGHQEIDLEEFSQKKFPFSWKIEEENTEKENWGDRKKGCYGNF